MIIYLDILFLKHFIMNYFLIEITSKALKQKTKVINKMIATILTSTYSVVTILYSLENTIIKILIATIIVLIAYSPREISDLIKDVIMLYVITYFIGGMMTSLINYFPTQTICAILAILIGDFLLKISRKILQDIIKKDNYFCNIQIQLGDELFYAKALIDTGHDLQDTISGDTVIIMTNRKIEEFSKELSSVLKGEHIQIPTEYETKIRMITYQSLGNKNGVLYGIKVDKVIAYYDGATIENKNVIMALTENEFQKFDAILGLNLLEEGEKIGNTSIIEIKSKKTMGKNFNYN